MATVNSGIKYALEIDGAFCGWIYSAEGGVAYSDVVTERISSDSALKKHLSGVKYEDIDIMIECEERSLAALAPWIREMSSQSPPRKHGAIITLDENSKPLSRLTFDNALMTEISFPALDTTGKDFCKIKIKITPEVTRRAEPQPFKRPLPSRHPLLPSNFSLKIHGLDDGCKNLKTIDALTLKRRLLEESVGQSRGNVLGQLETPNLVVTLPEWHADQFFRWHEEFVIKGNNGEGNEKSGTLEYLTPLLTKSLITLSFRHLGIFRLRPGKMESGSENIPHVKAEMYCEEIVIPMKEPRS